jgi:hypothetical protein
MGDKRNPKRPISDDIKEIISRGSRLAGGFFGDAARTVGGRNQQIDDIVDDALSGAHDRQHTDRSNR